MDGDSVVNERCNQQSMHAHNNRVVDIAKRRCHPVNAHGEVFL